MLFEGIMPAIFTIYDEKLNIKRDSVKKLVDYHLSKGVTGFYVCGNTGECKVLPVNTRKEMAEVMVEEVKGRGKIIVHVGAAVMSDVYELIDHCNKLKIDAISSLPPTFGVYYTIDETVDYYRMIAKRSVHPVIAYVWGVGGKAAVELARRIAEIDNVIGLKLTVSDYSAFIEIKQLNNGNINVLNGPDETMLCGLVTGADGAIGTSYNMFPKLAVSIYNSFKAGKTKEALIYQQKLTNLINSIIGRSTSETIIKCKAAMAMQGFDVGYNADPAMNLTDKQFADLKKELTEKGYFEVI